MAEKRICQKCKEAWCSADESKVWICDNCKAEIQPPLFRKKEIIYRAMISEVFNLGGIEGLSKEQLNILHEKLKEIDIPIEQFTSHLEEEFTKYNNYQIECNLDSTIKSILKSPPEQALALIDDLKEDESKIILKRILTRFNLLSK